VSGGSIHKLLKDYGSFTEPVIQNYTRQILAGLAYLHGRNTVHRDIKGANILVDPNGEIKLADFGMAKHVSISMYFIKMISRMSSMGNRRYQLFYRLIII
jgi:serine/threonine protein kinase